MRRDREPGQPLRSVKVQEPDVPAAEMIGTGKDGKERVAKVLQLSSFEVSLAFRTLTVASREG